MVIINEMNLSNIYPLMQLILKKIIMLIMENKKNFLNLIKN